MPWLGSAGAGPMTSPRTLVGGDDPEVAGLQRQQRCRAGFGRGSVDRSPQRMEAADPLAAAAAA
jgi:hypothetical protein